MAKVDCAYSIKGNGPPIFFIHGVGGRRAMWKKIIYYLSKKFTCISYDLRGHGQSPVSATPFNLNDLVYDLEALRKKLDIKAMKKTMKSNYYIYKYKISHAVRSDPNSVESTVKHD